MNHTELITLIVKSILRSSLCDYTDTFILVSATITVSNTAAAGAAANNKQNIIIKNCAPFTNYICEKNNKQKIMLKTLP